MTIIINSLDDLTRLKLYESMRDNPRRHLEHGLYPAGAAALDGYDKLLLALAGGDDATPDLSEYAEFHTNTLAQVNAFVMAIKVSIAVSNETMQIVNMLSQATQPSEPIPFNIPSKAIEVADYITTLQTAIATLQGTVAAMSQVAAMLAGQGE